MRAATAAVAAAVLLLVHMPSGAHAGAAPGSPAAIAPTAATHQDGQPGRLIVAFDQATPRSVRETAHTRAAAAVTGRLPAIGADVVTVADPARAAAAYAGRPDVRFVEPDETVRALAAPNDPGYDQQWNLHPADPANPASLNWEPVWSSRSPLGEGVDVAVVDSGFRSGGNDTPENVDTTRDRDFIRGDLTADDEHGHGTHVAGTIAQATGNAEGVAGVAPKATIIPIKVLDHEGAGPISVAIRGLQHAVDVGAEVINLSLGGPYSRAFCEAVAAASSRGVVVAASGNDSRASGWLPVSWPASCPDAIGVGGLARDGSRAPYSNAGCTLDVAAPGGHSGQRRADTSPYSILQETFGENGRFGYFYESGTSMAAGHVTGAAAVLLSQTPRPSITRVREVLIATARDLGPAGRDPATGAGAVDLKAAVDAVHAGPLRPPSPRVGYWQVASDGGIFAFGHAPFKGSTGDVRLNRPIVGMAATPTGDGYWLVASDGGIFAFGDARFHGSTGAIQLNRPIVGMAATPTGDGYWLVASDGGIFAFGDAGFHGSTGAIALRSPIVGLEPTPSGGGYWLVASDGGIFAFGDAPFQGSTGGIALNRPITAMAATLSGHGYWLVASDGGIFAFGDAGFHGSTGAIRLNSPIIGMESTCHDRGYWLVAADGGMFAFGDAPFLGSTGGMALSQPVVGMGLAIDMR